MDGRRQPSVAGDEKFATESAPDAKPVFVLDESFLLSEPLLAFTVETYFRTGRVGMCTAARHRYLVITVLIALVGCLAACGGGTSGGSQGTPGAGAVDLYSQTIQPILDSACSCHTPDDPQGGYSVAGTPYLGIFSQGLVIREKPGESRLLTSMRVTEWNQYFSAAQVEVITEWIELGAPQYAQPGDLPDNTLPGYSGAGNCTTCHTHVTDTWLTGAHANREARDSEHKPLELGLDAPGFPAYGYGGLGIDAQCTTVCHDPLRDGFDLIYGYTGNLPRPVVACESCHGPGGDHFGTGAIPTPRPDSAQCGPCHNATFDHNAYHPEADNIYEDYAASPHMRSINEHTFEEEATSDVRALCAKCHTDEGAKAFRGVDGGHDQLALEPTFQVISVIRAATPVQCRTCHTAHDPGQLLESPLSDAEGDIVASAEYRTCTNCHQTSDSYHGENSAYAWSGHAVNTGTFSGDSILYDTHFDDDATADIEGYVLDPTDERVCRNCHNVHAADATIHRQWADSGHGGHILSVKQRAAATPDNAGVAAVLTAGIDESHAAAWVHYDFKSEDRESCQHCHTATGFRNFIAAPGAYNAADNDFTASGEQRELLYCWACHADNSGTLYDPGALTLPYGGGQSFGYPDLGPSNVCIPCHAGMERGQRVLGLDPSELAHGSMIQSHYLAATGILFAAVGYEFNTDSEGEPLDYTDPAEFQHNQVGTIAGDGVSGETAEWHPGTGTSGPCVGCHMKDTGHRFEPIAEELVDAEPVPTCGACHTDADERTPLVIQGARQQYQDALSALAGQAASRGFHYYPNYPYLFDAAGLDAGDLYDHAVTNWYADTDGDGISATDGDADGLLDTPDPDDAWTGQHNLGACFNLVLLKHEPGAFTHNSRYAKRLIYDSIDWFDDHSLNGSVRTSVETLGDNVEYRAGALAYFGDTRP